MTKISLFTSKLAKTHPQQIFYKSDILVTVTIFADWLYNIYAIFNKLRPWSVLVLKNCFILNVYYKLDSGRSTHIFKSIIQKIYNFQFYITTATLVAFLIRIKITDETCYIQHCNHSRCPYSHALCNRILTILQSLRS